MVRPQFLMKHSWNRRSSKPGNLENVRLGDDTAAASEEASLQQAKLKAQVALRILGEDRQRTLMMQFRCRPSTELESLENLSGDDAAAGSSEHSCNKPSSRPRSLECLLAGMKRYF